MPRKLISRALLEKAVYSDSDSATLEGIEMAHMIRKGQFTPGLCPFHQFAELAT
jgi:hypothetical protein